ncbi:MAG: hypothetical protein PHY48_02585 [Candidatus Cloacimonetes bacterium]|nr:hypothetical protein [Candidatus Cloacimonadota bacterium]
MKTKIIKIILLCIISSSLSALRYIPGSAFNPEIRNNLYYSLLNYPENPREADISTYGTGLYHPFASVPRFSDAFVDAFRIGKARHSLIAYQSPDSLFKAEFNIQAGYEQSMGDQDYGFLYKGYLIKAALGKHLDLNTYWWNGLFTGDKASALHSELVDGEIMDNTATIRLDNITADISYNTNNYSAAIGRGKFPIGNSISGSIIMNDSVNDYAYLLAEGRIGDFNVSFIHASLKADSVYAIYTSPYVNKKNYPDKFIAMHQLSYHPTVSFKLFIGECVVYGNRGIDVNYLIPNAFWRASEHNLGDRDNVLVFGGAKLQAFPSLLLYGQMALDEFSYNKLFTSWWGNKYAIQGGARYTLPSFIPCSAAPSVTLELTAVRPFTYTHYMNHTMYSHDGRSLGYPKGSNIVDVSCGILLPLPHSKILQTKVSYSKQGSYGSDWRQNYNDVFAGHSTTGTAKWFEGTVTKRSSIDNTLLIDMFAHHRLLLGYSAEYQENWSSKLYAGWQLHY